MRSVALITCLCAALAWCVALGGLSALTDDCRVANGAKPCTKTFAYEWWGIWFQFFATAAIALMLQKEADAFIPTANVVMAALLSVIMLNTNSLLPAPGATGYDAQNAAAAGFLMLSIFDLALILLLGMVHTGTTVALPTPAPKAASPAKEAPAAEAASTTPRPAEEAA